VVSHGLNEEGEYEKHNGGDGAIRQGLTMAKVNAEVLAKMEPQYAVPIEKFIEGIKQLSRGISQNVFDHLTNV
jgi:hypothetical protein